MNLKTKAAAYGIAGVVLASAAIAAGANFGMIGPAASGLLSIMLTDPTSIPAGVTAVYVTYDNLGLHGAGLGDSGWIALGGHGTLETLGLVNLSETISSADVPSLSYDRIAFEITAAQVTFHGVNYSATVNGGRLVAELPGNIRVNPSKLTAVVLDIYPTVLNLGDLGYPHLVISALARAVQVPQAEVTNSMAVPDAKYSLVGRAWTQPLNTPHSDNITISGVSLASASFSFVATNKGNEAVEFKLVVVTPVSTGGTIATAASSLGGSFVFVAEADGTLQILHTTGLDQTMLTNAGYTIQPGASVHFSFTGAITSVFHQMGVSTSTNYYVYAIGQDAPQTSVQAA